VIDRVGIGWRPALAGSVFAHLDEIDVVEVIADNHFTAGRTGIAMLRRLADAVPVMLHGVGLGLASAMAPDRLRLDAMARLVDLVRPRCWSEHLAFVRAAGIELHHLAAPPRNAAMVEHAARNIAHARRVVGAPPAMENIATLVTPPCSTMDETEWLRAVIAASGAPLLLDLHNIYANATNGGEDPKSWLERLPLEQVTIVHIAGGRWTSEPRRWLDDHLHATPRPVFDLLTNLAARVRRPLTVLLERDGAYPPFEELLAELRLARAALARGRAEAGDGRRAA
jgi:uncharacterized protein (UPF0276 family)